MALGVTCTGLARGCYRFNVRIRLSNYPTFNLVLLSLGLAALPVGFKERTPFKVKFW